MSKVFISYSHDGEQHKDRVRGLADKLRAEGITVVLDRDKMPGGPPEGWPLWSETQVTDAGHVLVVCTKNYCRRYENKENPGTGLGSVCEARAIRQLLYNSGGYNEKFRVILFAEADNQYVPTQLQGYHRFLLYQPNGYQELTGWLHGTGPSQPQPLKGSQATSQASPANATINLAELTFPQTAHLVDLLLACQAINDRSTRDAVVNQLPGDVIHSIARDAVTRTDVFNIVKTCMKYPAGIRNLLERLKAFEGDSLSMQKLETWIAEI